MSIISNVDLHNPLTDHPLNRGLVGCWHAILRDFAGGNWHGISPYRNTASQSPATYVPEVDYGKYGLAARFGNSDHLDITDNSRIDGASQLTVAAFVRADATGTEYIIMYGGSTDHGIGMRYDSVGNAGGGTNVIKCAFGRVTSTDSFIESSSYAQTTEWQHLVAVFNAGSAIKLYIDGVLDVPTYTYANSQVIDLGAYQAAISRQASSTSWHGLIDSVRIYDRCLSAAEIRTLYTQSLSGYPDLLRCQPTPRTFLIESNPLVAVPNR